MMIHNEKDPLLLDLATQNYKKFGEIYCNEQGSVIYLCNFCPSQTKQSNDVEQHLITHLGDIFQLKSDKLSEREGCKFIEENEGSASPSEKGMEAVLQESISPLLECSTCGWKTKQRKRFEKHLRTHNIITDNLSNRDNPDLATIPQTATTTQQPKRKKSTKPVINCQLCDKQFHCQSYLDKHIDNHPFYPAIFECDLCGKRVKERKDFIEHMKRAHIGLKYPCKVCGKEFAQSSYVLIHMRMHNENRGHQCAVCGKTFFTSGALTSHMRKHNNTLNVLPCNLCGKIFHLPGALRDHVRLHSGEKPFKCELCPSSFRTRKFLNQHKFVHSETKLFPCELCGKYFKQASGKRVHKRKVHGKLVGIQTHSNFK